MNGSILFNKDINIEVDVDPSAEEGARLISAKNLVDGQELGIGGDSSIAYINRSDSDELDKTWSEINTLMRSDSLCIIKKVDDDLVNLSMIMNCDQTTLSVSTYNEVFVAASADDYPALD